MTAKNVNTKIDSAADKAKDMSSKVGHGLEAAGGHVTGMAHAVKDKVSEVVQHVGHQVEETAQKVGHAAQEMASRAENRVKHGAHEAGEKLKGA